MAGRFVKLSNQNALARARSRPGRWQTRKSRDTPSVRHFAGISFAIRGLKILCSRLSVYATGCSGSNPNFRIVAARRGDAGLAVSDRALYDEAFRPGSFLGNRHHLEKTPCGDVANRLARIEKRFRMQSPPVERSAPCYSRCLVSVLILRTFFRNMLLGSSETFIPTICPIE